MQSLIRDSLPRWAGVDVVVGLPKSGMLPASYIATALNVPLLDIDAFVYRASIGSGRRPLRGFEDFPRQGDRVLVVDDSISSGRALRAAEEKLKPFESR